MAAITSETGHTLTTQGIPDYLAGPYHTGASSLSGEEFAGTLRLWDSFESEVRHIFLVLENRLHFTGSLSIHATNPTRNDISNEQLYCGDESSIVARFNQNVSHVMTAVAQALGLNYRFGDYKSACADTRDVPDVALLDPSGQPRVVGEAKVPWNHNLSSAVRSGDAEDSNLRAILGESSSTL